MGGCFSLSGPDLPPPCAGITRSPEPFLGKEISPAAAMHWLGQPCALHARLAEGLLQVSARSLAWRGAPGGGGDSSSSSSPAAAGPRGAGVRLLSGQVQPNLATKQAPRSAHQSARLFWHGRSHRLSRGLLLPRAVCFALPAAGASSIRLPAGPGYREDDELLRLLFPLQGREAADAHQLLTEITLQATGSGSTAGGGGVGGGGGGSRSSVKAQKVGEGSDSPELAERPHRGEKPADIAVEGSALETVLNSRRFQVALQPGEGAL